MNVAWNDIGHIHFRGAPSRATKWFERNQTTDPIYWTELANVDIGTEKTDSETFTLVFRCG